MYNFDAKKVKNDIVLWIRHFFEENGKGCNAVVGISGGKDSSVVAALCVEALGKDRVIGVLMPNDVQGDIDFAFRLVSELDIGFTVCNIGAAVKEVTDCVERINHNGRGEIQVVMSQQASTNLPARIRMATLYAVSQSCNGRVANTCNLSEDWVGYSTRYGDSVGDFSPLSNLTTDEVIAVGIACGLSNVIVNKAPTDGLCGKTDEENLGFTYKQLNHYIRTGECEDKQIKKLIDEKHQRNLFKLQPMPCFPDPTK